MTGQSPEAGFEGFPRHVEDMASVFNLSDVQTEISPGQGWSCEPNPERGVVISIDPEQISMPSGEVKEEHVLFVSRHELQHARDMLDPEWKYQPDLSKVSQTDAFFWNFVHDITIDGRTVNDYTEYRKAAPDLYKTIVKEQNVRKEPKHIQLMKGLRFQSVLGEGSELRVDRDVQAEIDSLRNYDGHDITEILIHKGTTLQQRITLAEKFIKPVYDRLFEEEKENHSEGELEQQAADANQQADMTQAGSEPSSDSGDEKTFEEQLQQAAEEYQTSQETEEEEQSNGVGNEESEEEDEDENFISKLGKKVMSALAGKEEANGAAEDEDQPDNNTESFEEEIGKLGGTIQSELNLQRGDAESYARALIINRPMIRETAEIFKHLARIEEVQSRVRYNRQILPEGEKLHTGRLPEAYIQGISEIPMDIWKGKERKAPKTIRQFSGLDVQLLIDASLSMNGAPALHASHMGVVLAEGLLLARRQQAKEIRGKQPDVRLGSMIFAGDTEDVMPLSHEPTGPDRATMFVNTKRAGQYNTLVCPGLRAIVENARQNPDRDIIGIVISDNAFGDSPLPLVSSKPDNCVIWNFSLGGSDSLGVGKYAANINQTSELPAKLLKILKNYERQFA
jgi:hypothetical protein